MVDIWAEKTDKALLNVTATEGLYLAAQLIHYEAENHQKHSEATAGWKKHLQKLSHLGF